MKQLLLKINKLLEVNFNAKHYLQPNEDERRRINLVNYISIISMLNMLVYVVIYTLVDFQLFAPASYFLTLSSFVNVGIIWINKRGKHQLAKILLSLATPFSMLYIATVAFGKDPGFHVYLFVAAIIPLFLWNLRNNIYPVFLISIILIAYFIVEFVPLKLQHQITLSEDYIHIFRQTNIFVCFTAAGLAVVVYQWLHNKTEEQLVIQSEKLKISQKQKDNIYSIIGHDLRGPIGNFVQLTEIYTNNYIDNSEKERLELMSSIHSSSVSIMNLLENLLDWSKMQSGVKEISLSKFSLLDIVNETLTLYDDLLSKEKIHTTVNVKKSIELFADKYMVSTILRNLVSNAVKFTYQSGEITISANEKGSKVEICVGDSGIGLTDTDIKNLFDMEKVYKVTPLSKEKGSGLGLILCKDFVEAHKGKIWVESKVGEGTKFYFTLPKAEKLNLKS
jgi:signal transduction histidine kinase